MKTPKFIKRLLDPYVQKALYDIYPQLLDRQPIFRTNSADEQAGQTASDYNSGAQSYTNYMWYQRAVNILANNIAPLPQNVVQGTGKEKKYLTNHELTPLLQNPNPAMSASDLSRQWVVEMMIGGEIGYELVGAKSGNKILEMWPRQANTITVHSVPASSRYFKVDNYTIADGNGKPYDLQPEQLLHSKFYNPLSPMRGLAPITAIRMSIVIDQLAQVWTRLFFKNAARPDFAVIAPAGMTKSEKDELEKLLLQKFGMAGDGMGRPLILEQGVTDIKTFSFPPKDMEWLNTRQISRSEVAAFVGVPEEIIGFGKDTYQNVDAAERILWTLTILPLIGLRDDIQTAKFRRLGKLTPIQSVETDIRGVPQLQEDKSELITQGFTLWKMGVPLNQISTFLDWGLEAQEGGDIGYVPAAFVPIGTPRIDPNKTVGGTGQPPADNTPPNEDTGTDAPPKKSINKTLELGSPEHEALWKGQQAALDPFVTKLQRVVKKEIQRQQNEIGSKLRAGKMFGHGRYKDDAPENIPTPQELFDLTEEIKKWVASLNDPITTSVQDIGDQALHNLGLSGTFDISRPEVVSAIKDILNTVSTETNNTTWNDLVQIFQDAETNGDGIPAIQEALSAYFGDRKSDWQTERIARTTMTAASNAGTHDAWDQSGVVKTQTWISALLPNRTRPAHAEAHGQTVGLHEMFDVGGEKLAYPGDPNGSPGNIINCMCTTIAGVEQ